MIFCRKTCVNFKLCLGKHQLLHCKCTNSNVLNFAGALCRLQEMVLKGSYGHFLIGVMFPKWKLVNQRNRIYHKTYVLLEVQGGGPRVVVSTAAFQARIRGSVPGLGDLKETKMFLPHPRVKVSIAGSHRDREVACSASDRQGSNFESCVWRTLSSQSSHHPQEALLVQFSL